MSVQVKRLFLFALTASIATVTAKFCDVTFKDGIDVFKLEDVFNTKGNMKKIDNTKIPKNSRVQLSDELSDEKVAAEVSDKEKKRTYSKLISFWGEPTPYYIIKPAEGAGSKPSQVQRTQQKGHGDQFDIRCVPCVTEAGKHLLAAGKLRCSGCPTQVQKTEDKLLQEFPRLQSRKRQEEVNKLIGLTEPSPVEQWRKAFLTFYHAYEKKRAAAEKLGTKQGASLPKLCTDDETGNAYCCLKLAQRKTDSLLNVNQALKTISKSDRVTLEIEYVDEDEENYESKRLVVGNPRVVVRNGVRDTHVDEKWTYVNEKYVAFQVYEMLSNTETPEGDDVKQIAFGYDFLQQQSEPLKYYESKSVKWWVTDLTALSDEPKFRMKGWVADQGILFPDKATDLEEQLASLDHDIASLTMSGASM